MTLRSPLLAAALLAASAASAQDPAAQPAPAAPAAQPAPAAGGSGTMIGLGVNLRELDLTGMASVYVPIQLASGLRVEPEIGLALGLTGGDMAMIRLGVGIFPTWMVQPNVRAYVGGRGQLAVYDIEGSDVQALRLAAAAGAEWVPVPRVALGVEAQAAFVLVDDGFAFGASDSGIATAGQAFLRVFLW